MASNFVACVLAFHSLLLETFLSSATIEKLYALEYQDIISVSLSISQLKVSVGPVNEV